MTNKTNMTYKVKIFIKNFNFPNPTWDNLPSGFLSEPGGSPSRWPAFDKNGLTREEGHLLDGIKLAWVVSGGGRQYFYKTVARKAILGVAVVIFAVLLGRNLVIGRDAGITRSVSAKTVSQVVGEVVQATMSAVFKK